MFSFVHVFDSVHHDMLITLSLFLFNIYTDSLSLVPNSCNLESYVDDSKTFLYRFHYRIWNVRYCITKGIYTEFLNSVVSAVFL